jgi:hypothetical protein
MTDCITRKVHLTYPDVDQTLQEIICRHGVIESLYIPLLVMWMHEGFGSSKDPGCPDNRAGIFSRFEAKDWANTTHERLIAKLKPEIELHEADARRFMKGIYFDWSAG